MENNKNNKGLIVLVIFLIVIIIGLSGFIVYDKTNNKTDKKESTTKINVEKDNKATTKNTKYDISNVKGIYVYNNGKDTSDANYEKYELILLDNGLFVYTLSNVSNNTIIGNYYIDNNNVVLNYLYASGVIGGPSLLTISGSRKLNINGDSLIDNNTSIGNEYIYFVSGGEKSTNVKNITLTKSNETPSYTSETLSTYISSKDTSLLNSSSPRP